MHPLIPLAQKPALLCLLPIVGKTFLTGLFLLVPVSCVVLLWYKNYRALLFLCSSIAPWIVCWWIPLVMEQHAWQQHVKSLPSMFCSTVSDPTVAIKIVAHQLKKIIADCPETEVVIMPESAFNVSNFADFPELVQLWNSGGIGKAIHLVFGASRWREGNYYNSLHWVYNGVLQSCYDKQHAMLISERLSPWMNNTCMERVYFNQASPITQSCNERIKLVMREDNSEFVPYICSELFFSELPDDTYGHVPIIAVINDLLFVGNVCSSYIQKLLVLLARSKAIQWQRDIVYVSYARSLFIDKQGMTQTM